MDATKKMVVKTVSKALTKKQMAVMTCCQKGAQSAPR